MERLAEARHIIELAPAEQGRMLVDLWRENRAGTAAENRPRTGGRAAPDVTPASPRKKQSPRNAG